MIFSHSCAEFQRIVFQYDFGLRLVHITFRHHKGAVVGELFHVFGRHAPFKQFGDSCVFQRIELVFHRQTELFAHLCPCPGRVLRGFQLGAGKIAFGEDIVVRLMVSQVVQVGHDFSRDAYGAGIVVLGHLGGQVDDVLHKVYVIDFQHQNLLGADKAAVAQLHDIKVRDLPRADEIVGDFCPDSVPLCS